MNIRLIVITSNIQASARLKQALEETERFQVIPFTDPVAAIDYIKRDPQTVAVVDMEIPEAPGAILIDSLLTVQPDLVVFASTSNSDRATEAVSAGAWGLLPKTYSARDVLNQIEQSPLPSVTSSLAETSRSSAVNPDDTPLTAVAEEPERGADGLTVSERLAAEEPPLPSVEEGGTVATLMAMPEEEMSSMFEKLTANESELNLTDEDDVVSTDTAAHRILELANTDVDPLEESDSFDDFLAEQGMDQTTPPYVREPDFLMDTSFDDEDDLQDTQPADAALMLQNFDTNWTGSEAETMPQPDPQDVSQLETLETTELGTDGDNDETELADPVEGMTDQLTEDYAALVEEYDDPQIAQMAVNLTQMSLESTAEATVLSKGNMLVAYAGPLSDADIDALSDKIADGWKDIGESNSRVRYVTLPSNGLDYLVYSRRTHEDFVLSMVFAGKTPLSVIREQGKRIGDALRSVPERTLEVPPSATDEEGLPVADNLSRGGMVLQGAVVDESLILADHTFVWLLKDPTQELEYATAEAINAGLRVQLHEIGWRVDVLEVQEDYVYLLAGVPEEQPPYEVVQGLQSRASKIARQQDGELETDGLWADSYFILSPGRELNVQEIQQYINFYRM